LDDKIVINENITALIPYLAKDPLIFALVISIVLICCATKLANATIPAQIFFIVIAIAALIFAWWVINQFIANGIGK
jgi:hypothetical protein